MLEPASIPARVSYLSWVEGREHARAGARTPARDQRRTGKILWPSAHLRRASARGHLGRMGRVRVREWRPGRADGPGDDAEHAARRRLLGPGPADDVFRRGARPRPATNPGSAHG